MSTEDVTITHRADRHRFELAVDGEVVGYSTYRDADGVRTFLHTEIDPSVEGRGFGSQLIREALDQTRAAGLSVVPQCPFVRAFIEQHPEYADLVDAA
ncbi:MAG TPA: GNAT family N-acetyltransferase [Mycobacteriales bacterium]|nr:GNAT family N-acetyltransferase [Mycobacteriales bacterium]